ncbi:hypothetical protein SCANM63S_04752 [Streptomyces canarius]
MHDGVHVVIGCGEVGHLVRRHGGVRGGHRMPVDPEQRPHPGGLDLTGRERAHHQRFDGRDRESGLIGHGDRDFVGAGRRQPHPQGRRTRREQARPAPAERQPEARCFARGRSGLAGRQPQGVQRRVQKRRVQAELPGRGALCLGQRDLGVHLVAAPPGRPEPLEARPVLVPLLGEAGVQICRVQRFGPGRGPLAGQPVRRRGAGRQRAGGVPRPFLLGASVFLPGVQVEGASSGLVGRAHGELEDESAVVGEDQGCFQGEFLDGAAAELLGGVLRQFQERRPRQQHRPVHRMVGQPRMRPQRQPPREQLPLGIRQRQRRTQQRMPRTAQTHRAHVAAPAAPDLQPVPLALEGVRRQLPAGRRATEERRPLHLHAPHEQLRQRHQEAAQTPVLTPQRPRHDSRVTQRLGSIPAVRTGCALTSTNAPNSCLGQGPHGGLEPHRLPQVAEPVPRVEFLPAEPLGVHRGEERHRGRPGGHPLQHPQDLLADLLHLCGVRGVVHGDAPGPLHTAQDLLQTVRIARHDDGRGAVHRRHRHTVGQQITHLLHREGNRDHPAPARQRGDRPRPQRHHPRAVLQRQRTRHHGSRDLTLRMTQHRGRPHPHRLPQRRQRHHHRPQHRLHHVHPAELTRGHHLRQRPLHKRRQRRLTLRHPRREHRRRIQQLHRHPRPLRPLTREHEHRLAHGRNHTRHHAGQRLTRRNRLQTGLELPRRPTDDHRTMLEHRPARQTRTHRGPVLTHQRHQPTRLRTHRVHRTTRHHPRHHRRHHRRRHRTTDRFLRSRLLHRSLLQNQVGVRTTEPERRHTGPARTVLVIPRPLLRQQLHLARRPVDMRRRLVHVQGPGQHAVPHRQHHLDHTGHTGGQLRVADVGLDGAQPEWFLPVLSVGGQQRLRLDRVTERRARAVRLHHVHLGRLQPGIGQRLPDHPPLREAAGRGQAVGRAVLVGGAAPDHRQHRVPVAPRVRQPLQDHHADTLGHAHAVGRGGERLAAAVLGEAALSAEADEALRVGHHGDTAGEGERALARAQRLARQVHRHQRRRTRRVHADRGTLQTEGVRDPAGRHAGGAARDHLALQPFRDLGVGAVALVAGADEDTGPLAALALRVDTGPLERLPRGLQQQPLLRVHRERLTRADSEEQGVEVARRVQEAAVPGVRRAGPVRVRVVEAVQVPAAVGREVGDDVAARAQQFPQLLRGVDATREPAGHPHQCDRLVLGRDHDRGPRGGGVLGQLRTQVAGDGVDVGVVEDDRGGQPQAGRGVQPVAQLHRGERVEADVPEGALGIDRVTAGVAEDRGHLFAYERDELGLGKGSGRRCGDRAFLLGEGRHLRYLVQQRAGTGGGEDRREARPVHLGDREDRLVVVQGPLKGRDRELRVDERQALAPDPVHVEAAGHGGGIRQVRGVPDAPGDGRGRHAAAPQVLGVGVEEGVGGGIGAVVTAAPDPGDGGEEDERVEVGQQLGQVNRAGRLGPQDGVEPFRGLGGGRLRRRARRPRG